MRIFFVSLLLLACAGAALGAESSGLQEQLDVLVRDALQNNPDLQAGQERWSMFEQKIPQSQSLDDPMLGIAFSNYPLDSLKSDQTPMTGNEIRLAQKFPFPGKLDAKGEVARQQARWYQAVYEDARLRLAGQVKEQYFRLCFIARAIEVTEKNLQILDSFTQLTMTRYEVGKGLQQDVLKAQVEQSKLLDKLLSLRQQRQSAQAALDRLVGRSAAASLDLSGALPAVADVADAQLLKEAARHNRPLFTAYETLIKRYASQRKLADLDYYPNFEIWTSYRFRDDDLPDGGTDFISAGIGISLPIWRDKRSAAVAEADTGMRMASRQFEDFRNQVDFSIEDSLAQLQKNHQQAQLFASGIIPQAQQSFDASLSAYQVGKVELLTLLDSLMTLYRYQIDYQRALTDALRDAARLEAAVGSSLANGPDAAAPLNLNGTQP